MKKKIIYVSIMVLIACSMLATLSGCDSLFGITKQNVKTLSIHIGEKVYEKEVFVGDEVEFLPTEIPTKSGYYLTGYFDSQSGGTEYLDCNGKSNGIWKEEDPTTLYAQWESVDNFCIVKGGYWENTYKYFGEKVLSMSIGTDKNMNKVSAIAGNLDRRVKVVFSFKISCPSYAGWGDDPDKDITRMFYFQDANDSGAEIFAKKSFSVHGLEYNEFSFDIECDAHTFRKRSEHKTQFFTMYIKFLGSDYYPTYVKDMEMEVFILPAKG